ncbi:hypothetical protein FE257_011151 [Aspergillus nanangensis]|uniref:Uncharacterized protein n=1 Tax=Aspergillus nanangensis TaxID=2582783 RepID=A0AAD4CHU7_ASPNN|nr:hypothetical protein FE257_011151 [Aspergillus nanangensis]
MFAAFEQCPAMSERVVVIFGDQAATAELGLRVAGVAPPGIAVKSSPRLGYIVSTNHRHRQLLHQTTIQLLGILFWYPRYGRWQCFRGPERDNNDRGSYGDPLRTFGEDLTQEQEAQIVRGQEDCLAAIEEAQLQVDSDDKLGDLSPEERLVVSHVVVALNLGLQGLAEEGPHHGSRPSPNIP